MGRLIVEAVVTNGLVRPGTVEPLPVTVSVTRSDGSPVATLTQGNFTIGNTFGTFRLQVQNFRGGNVQIGLGSTNAGGLYMFDLIPIPGSTWTPWATFHIVIVVQSGTNRGQTIGELTFPAP